MRTESNRLIFITIIFFLFVFRTNSLICQTQNEKKIGDVLIENFIFFVDTIIEKDKIYNEFERIKRHRVYIAYIKNADLVNKTIEFTLGVVPNKELFEIYYNPEFVYYNNSNALLIRKNKNIQTDFLSDFPFKKYSILDKEKINKMYSTGYWSGVFPAMTVQYYNSKTIRTWVENEHDLKQEYSVYDIESANKYREFYAKMYYDSLKRIGPFYDIITYNIKGKVINKRNEPVNDVQVFVTEATFSQSHIDTVSITKTNNEGIFCFPSLNLNTYYEKQIWCRKGIEYDISDLIEYKKPIVDTSIIFIINEN